MVIIYLENNQVVFIAALPIKEVFLHFKWKDKMVVKSLKKSNRG